MTMHRWLVGFFLLICMLAALFLNAIMFSSRSFQHYVAQVAPQTGGIIRLAEIEALSKEVGALETRMAPLMAEAAAADAAAVTARGELDRTRDRLGALQAQVLASVDRLEAEAGRAPAAPSTQYDEITLKARLDALATARAVPAAVRAAIPAVRSAMNQVGDVEDTISTLTPKLTAAERVQAAAGDAVAQARGQIVQKQTMFGADFRRVAAEAEALKASSPLGIGRTFAEMHPTFLSTLLVCVMGALGAILYLFPLYMVPNANVHFRDIIVRLVFGMATALAFYIVANATLAGFSLSGGSGDQAQSVGSNLNPFTVSLLGIIAGVMSMDIAKWILDRARELLGGAVGAAPSSSMPADPGPSSSTIDPNTGRPL
jgi:hypothetical protein